MKNFLVGKLLQTRISHESQIQIHMKALPSLLQCPHCCSPSFLALVSLCLSTSFFVHSQLCTCVILCCWSCDSPLISISLSMYLFVSLLCLHIDLSVHSIFCPLFVVCSYYRRDAYLTTDLVASDWIFKNSLWNCTEC